MTVLNSCHFIVVTAVEDGVGLHGTGTVDENIYPLRLTGQYAPSSANAIATALPIPVSAAVTHAIFLRVCHPCKCPSTAQAAEPAIGEIEMNLIAQPPFLRNKAEQYRLI